MPTASAVVSPINPSVKGSDARAIFRAAYAQARRQLRPSPRHGLGSRYGWTLDALRRRFGAGAWPITQAAVRIVFDARTPMYASTGTEQELARQGLVRRGKACGC